MVKNYVYCLIVCFAFVFESFSQDLGKAILLKTVLEDIAQDEKVIFNYLEDEIAVFKIIPPSKNKTLQEKLEYISAKTNLKFKYNSKNYISIINNKNLDKPLCGFVYDALTNLPMSSVSVHYINTQIFEVTDENGYFELPIKAENDVEFTHINYEKLIIKPETLQKEICPKIFIKETYSELAEVVTNVILTKGIFKKNDGTFQITPKKFGLLPGLTEPDVFQTMQQLPGITSVDETISNINVRGGTHDQNLILWNGIRLFQTGHFFGLISALNPNLANKIKISKNGSSAFYGESVSSTVDISSHAQKNENSSSVSINMINVDFNSSIKTSKKSLFSFSARRSHTDVINSPTYKKYYNRIFQNTIVTELSSNESIQYKTDEDFYFYDFTAQFEQQIGDKSKLFIDGISVSNLLDILQEKTENNIVITKNSCLEQQSLGGNITLETNWNSKFKTKANFYTSYYNINSENEAIQSNQIFKQQNNILDTGAKLELNYTTNNQFTINSGYQYNETGIRNYDKINSPVFSRKIKDVLRIHALVGEIVFNSKNEKLISKFGNRLNYIEQLQEIIYEPRVQFNYAISKNFNIELLGEIKSQTSSQIIDLQQDFLGVEKRRWILSNNEDIPVIKNNQVSFGISFKKNKWLITIDNFYKKVTGITSNSQAFQNQLEFVKLIGDFTVIGSEVLLQKQIGKNTTWLSYAFNENVYTFNDFETPSFANNFEIKHNVTFGSVYDINSFKIALGARWHSGKPITQPVNTSIENGTINYEKPNSSRVDDYLQVNASVSYTFEMTKKSKLQIGASVQNITNRKNIINQYYRINQNTNTIEQLNTYSLEITPNAFIRFSF